MKGDHVTEQSWSCYWCGFEAKTLNEALEHPCPRPLPTFAPPPRDR